jgi:hypothetical protein
MSACSLSNNLQWLRVYLTPPYYKFPIDLIGDFCLYLSLGKIRLLINHLIGAQYDLSRYVVQLAKKSLVYLLRFLLQY